MGKIRVLVVDDEDNILEVLQEYFRHRGDECSVASSGAEAIEILRERDFDVLVTDMSMPAMDGLELVERARIMRPQLVCVLMSGVGTRRDIIAAMKIGVFDFLDKPFPDFSAFSVIIARAADQSRLIRERNELLEHLQQQNAKLEISLSQLHEAYGRLRRQEETLESDLLQAQRVQRKLLPQGFPYLKGLDLRGYFRPCERLGGDFFGTIPLGKGRLAVYLVDVAGHGVSAAMITVILRELIHAQRMLDPMSEIFASPGKTLAFLNQGLLEEAFDPPILVTMVYCVLDTANSKAVCACAGHPPPILVAGEGNGRLLPVGGPVLGMNLPGKFDTAEVTLAPGDFLLLYSDGLSDMRDPEGSEYTEERLCQTTARAHGRSAAEIAGQVQRELSLRLGARSPADDVTFLVISRPAKVEQEAAPPCREGDIVPDSVHVVFPEHIRRAEPAQRGEIEAGWADEKRLVIRLLGLATWQQAPALRELWAKAAAEAVDPIHVDLSSCQGMDSTMLGMLYQNAPRVLLHQAGARPVAQLREMGILDSLRVTDAPAPPIAREFRATSEISREAASDLILSAHESLMEASEDNRKRFEDLVQSLRKQTGKKEE